MPIEAWDAMHFLSLVTPQSSWPYSYSWDLAFRSFLYLFKKKKNLFSFLHYLLNKNVHSFSEIWTIVFRDKLPQQNGKNLIWNLLWNSCVTYLMIEGYFPNTAELKLQSDLLRFSRACSGHQALKRVMFLCLIPLLDLAYSHSRLIFFPS